MTILKPDRLTTKICDKPQFRFPCTSSDSPPTGGAIRLFIWARIDYQRQRALVTGYPSRHRPAFRIAKSIGGVHVQDAVST
jgi:hypothetical protein